MKRIVGIIFVAILIGCVSKRNDHAILRPYVEKLKEEVPADQLRTIRAMGADELILLHHGFGTWIRNKWLWGDNNAPELVAYFRSQGITHPDSMSGVIIKALWEDLNAKVTPEEARIISEMRATVAKRRKNFETLETECTALLTKHQAQFDSCYDRFGLPTSAPKNREPFFQLIVEKNGKVKEVGHWKNANPELKACLEKVLRSFNFSPFDHDEHLTVYTITYPHCRVSERDSLHQ